MNESYILVVGLPSDARDELIRSINTLLAGAKLKGLLLKVFDRPDEAITYTGEHPCPVIFTGMELPGMDGFTMIRRIREAHAHTNFILFAAKREFVLQALQLKLRLSGYILGHPDVASVLDQMENLWFPLDDQIA